MGRKDEVMQLKQNMEHLRNTMQDVKQQLQDAMTVLDGEQLLGVETEALCSRLMHMRSEENAFLEMCEAMQISIDGNSLQNYDQAIAQEQVRADREKYYRIIAFVQGLYTQDEKILAYLEELKTEVSNLGVMSLSEETLDKTLERYVLLSEAFAETDDEKRFEYVFALANAFSQHFAYCWHSGKLLQCEPTSDASAVQPEELSESTAQAEEQQEPESTAEAEEQQEPESAAQAEEQQKPESTAQAEEQQEPKSTAQAEEQNEMLEVEDIDNTAIPVVQLHEETVDVVSPRPEEERETAASVDPVCEEVEVSESAAEEPATEPEAVAENEPATEPETVAENEPATEPATVAENEPATEPETIAQEQPASIPADCETDLPSQESSAQSAQEIVEKLLGEGRIYEATAYMCAAVDSDMTLHGEYEQLAYAVNDPMLDCSYSSEKIFDIYLSENESANEYYLVAAVLRNFFFDQVSYDYQMKQLTSSLEGVELLEKYSMLKNLIYRLQEFKEGNHSGIDRYADYRRKEKSEWERQVNHAVRTAKELYDSVILGHKRERVSLERLIHTKELLFNRNGDLGQYLAVCAENKKELLPELQAYLTETFVRDRAAICTENIDNAKVEQVLDDAWDRADEQMQTTKKSVPLAKGVRSNVTSTIKKLVRVMCDYANVMDSSNIDDNDSGMIAYKRIRDGLIADMQSMIEKLKPAKTTMSGADRAGATVLADTLIQLRDRLNGTYPEYGRKYFYVGFLCHDEVMLDTDFMPVLTNVEGVDTLSAQNRILRHAKLPEYQDRTTLHARLLAQLEMQMTVKEGNLGSAERIMDYFKETDPVTWEQLNSKYNVKQTFSYVQASMGAAKTQFIEDLELFQSYGQIDRVEEKEQMLRTVAVWYEITIDSMNYGFFKRILGELENQAQQQSKLRTVELKNRLDVYKRRNADEAGDADVTEVLTRIEQRIQDKNYVAAEDLLVRLGRDDFHDSEIIQTEYLNDFLASYPELYRKAQDMSQPLGGMIQDGQRKLKEIRNSEEIAKNWIRNGTDNEDRLKTLLQLLGFRVASVVMQEQVSGHNTYKIMLNKAPNGRKENYSHPISAFGSEAEKNGFHVICLYGRFDADRLLDIFKGLKHHTLVLLNYALTESDRRRIARLDKKETNGYIHAVIDRVALLYILNHYTNTSVNRMIMAVTMPFTACQPYVEDFSKGMPQEMFIGREEYLRKIEDPKGVNIVYGGRQLGKSALLRMAKNNIDHDDNGDRAVLLDIRDQDCEQTARRVSEELVQAGILVSGSETADWEQLASAISRRLDDTIHPITYLLLMLDEADAFIRDNVEKEYRSFDALERVQNKYQGRFKFVVAGLRNVLRFYQDQAISRNSVFPKLTSLTVRPFSYTEAKELLEVPLSYAGFHFGKDRYDEKAERLISTILSTTNYFPGMLQLYCSMLLNPRDVTQVYDESQTPPYEVQEKHIKRILANEHFQSQIRERFFMTLRLDEDDFYYMIALLIAYRYYEEEANAGCSAKDILMLAEDFGINKLTTLTRQRVDSLMKELEEMNILQRMSDGRYTFARYTFYQMMGNPDTILEEIEKYIGE